MPGLNRNEAYAQDIIIPKIVEINNFNSEAKHLFDLIDNNEGEIKSLTQIRDTLLPKLRSGEIDV